MKIILSNWINILGIFIVSVILISLNTFIFTDANIIISIFGALVSVCYYGLIFWILFLLSLLILDVILLFLNLKSLRLKLFLEWLIISTPFVYWSIKYNQWIFIFGIISFLFTQYLREKIIKQMLKKVEQEKSKDIKLQIKEINQMKSSNIYKTKTNYIIGTMSESDIGAYIADDPIYVVPTDIKIEDIQILIFDSLMKSRKGIKTPKRDEWKIGLRKP